jgi:hypothetical protein
MALQPRQPGTTPRLVPYRPADARAVIGRRGQTLREAALADAIRAETGTVAVAENPAETLAPDVNPTCQSRVLLMRPSESGAPGLNKAPAGPFDPAGLGPGESGTPGPNKALARADETGQGTGTRGSANSLTARCDLVSMSPRNVICQRRASGGTPRHGRAIGGCRSSACGTPPGPRARTPGRADRTCAPGAATDGPVN